MITLSDSFSWWCCIITRDGAETLGTTLDSIIRQSIPPEFIVVVDDNSKDRTAKIIEEKKKSFPGIFTIRTRYETRDIRRVPMLLNLGLDFFASRNFSAKMPNYMMVSGDDNDLSTEYVSRILSKMEQEKKQVVVASGSWPGSSGRMPHGAGRLVCMDFMKKVGGRYPVAYGWETWLLYKALELGYDVKNYHEVRYTHLRPYNANNLFGWGRAMYSLGFPSYFVFLRFLINFAYASRGTQSRKASVTMLVGFIQAKLNRGAVKDMLIEDDDLKSFVRRFATRRLVRLKLF